MVLRVVQLHDLRIDHRLQRRVVVRQVGQLGRRERAESGGNWGERGEGDFVEFGNSVRVLRL